MHSPVGLVARLAISRTTEHLHLVPTRRESRTQFLDVVLDPAIGGGKPLLSNHGDAQGPRRVCQARRHLLSRLVDEHVKERRSADPLIPTRSPGPGDAEEEGTYSLRMIRARYGLGAVAATLALASATTGTSTPAGAVTPHSATTDRPRGRVDLTWAPTHVATNHHYTRRQAVALARRFDLLTALPIAFQRFTGAMRRANPSLTLLGYTNATFANRAVAASAPEYEFAHDENGRRITSTNFGQYLMEPSDPGWQHTSVNLCVNLIDRSSYDGCLLDVFGMAVYSPGYVSALPARPGTGITYTETEWRQQLVDLAGAFASHRPALTYVGNAVGNAYRYWLANVTSQPIVRSLPGALMEDFLRGARDSVTSFPVGADWKRNLEIVRDFERANRTGLFLTKLWVNASPRQVGAWEAYSLATFLLAANGHTFIAFTDGRSRDAVSGRDLPFRLRRNIGMPTSGFQASGGVYRRHFGHGLVLVNPTLRSRAVRLHASFRTLGGRVVHRLRLGPHSGEVLTARR